MTDPLSRFESVVDEQIRKAQKRGDFDDLPGSGQPLPGWGGQDDEHWWLREYVRREGLSTEALLPTSVQLAKQVERLPETVRELATEQEVREVVRELNRRIAEHLRAPSGPNVPVRPVRADDVVAQWRAGRPAPAEPPPGPAPPQRTQRRRWFGRRRRGA